MKDLLNKLDLMLEEFDDRDELERCIGVAAISLSSIEDENEKEAAKKHLEEIIDRYKNQLIVRDYVIENTGGNVFVAWGGFEDGTYYAISSDLIMIYDADEYKAMDTDEYDDGYAWQLKHCIASFSYEMPQYKFVQRQIYDRCTNWEKMVDIFGDIDDEEE